MISVGIDPGSKSWSLVRLHDGALADERSIGTADIKKSISQMLDYCRDADSIVAPSGFGTGVKMLSEANEDDFAEMLMKREGDCEVMGLERVLCTMKEDYVSTRCYLIPGVKLLPTVPIEKKAQKIDMGTADKLCVAAAALADYANRNDRNYSSCSLIVAEIGFGFDAFIKIESGKIVDGIGGSLASSIHLEEDGEIPYLRGELEKRDLLRDPSDLGNIVFSAIRDINSLKEESEEIVLSGRLAKEVEPYLREKFKALRMLNSSTASNAAYGAAAIADGLAKGRFKGLVESLKLRDACGSNLDYVNI